MSAPARHIGRDWFADVRAQGVARVAGAFGYELVRRGRSLSTRCPVPSCGHLTRHRKTKDKRGAVELVAEGLGWLCYQCDARGDAVAFAALVVTGHTDAGREGWVDVRRACAEKGLCDHDPRDNRPAPKVRRLEPPPMPAPSPPQRPDAAELAALWAATLRLDAVPAWDGGAEWCGDVRVFLGRRRLDCLTLLERDAARILPPPGRFTYPTWWPSSWATTWRLAVPLFDVTGAQVAFQARDVRSDRKTSNPRGDGGITGTFFADANGRALLRGTFPGAHVVLVEGLTDFLTAAQLAARMAHPPAVLGIVAGSAGALTRVDGMAGRRLNVLTDNDPTGERYFEQVRQALPNANGVRVRLAPMNGKRADLNDLHQKNSATAAAAIAYGMKDGAA